MIAICISQSKSMGLFKIIFFLLVYILYLVYMTNSYKINVLDVFLEIQAKEKLKIQLGVHNNKDEGSTLYLLQ